MSTKKPAYSWKKGVFEHTKKLVEIAELKSE